MKESLAIQIQAYLDGELSKEASDQLLAELVSHPEAEELLRALRAESDLLKSLPEKEHSLPVAHGYFWKGISEGIAVESDSLKHSHNRPGLEPWKRWLSWLLPAFGAACVALMGIQQGWIGGSSDNRPGDADRSNLRRAPSFHEVDSRQQNAGFISFRSESEGVSVVWISND